MRLWSISPKYLDVKGLVAVWREGLLAQKVLKGETKGYKHHPQLKRFKNVSDSVSAISSYLYYIYLESKKRNYNFNFKKIDPSFEKFSEKIIVTDGQLEYEFKHLKTKLRVRDKVLFNKLANISKVEAHPIFKIENGDICFWEKI